MLEESLNGFLGRFFVKGFEKVILCISKNIIKVSFKEF